MRSGGHSVSSADCCGHAPHFALEPLRDGRTRLFARSRIPRGIASLGYALFIELPHFVMERKMMLTIKQRAEEAHAAAAGNGPTR
jgi:hypothetical protein